MEAGEEQEMFHERQANDKKYRTSLPKAVSSLLLPLSVKYDDVFFCHIVAENIASLCNMFMGIFFDAVNVSFERATLLCAYSNPLAPVRRHCHT